MATGTAGTGYLRPVGMLFTGLPESDFADFMVESDRFIANHPEIKEAIRRDLERHGKEKKKERMEDRRWERFRTTGALPGMEPQWEQIETENLQLEDGRPRKMDGYVTFMLMMARGYQGGESSGDFQDLIQESRTMQVLLANKGISMPAASTIGENLNAAGNKTRRMIHRRHLEAVKAEELDDFTEMTLDSTGVEGNTAWPTDSMIITGLIDRLWRTGNKLEQFGTENFQRHWTETWLGKMRRLNFKITNADTARERKKHYRRLYHFAENALKHLEGEAGAFEGRVQPEGLKPSLRRRLKDVKERLSRDLERARKVISYSKKRVLEGGKTSSTKKVLSLADADAAFIKKGDREPLIGYRPQVGRSAGGFVGYLEVPEGNASDAPRLGPAARGWVRNTGVVPRLVSTDDGYASAEGKKTLDGLGVEKVSISGSKGKRLLGKAEWNDPRIALARRQRSKVESTVFTLKAGFGLGRASRTGLEAVRAECLEKVIAYNVHRAVELRRRGQGDEASRAA